MLLVTSDLSTCRFLSLYFQLSCFYLSQSSEETSVERMSLINQHISLLGKWSENSLPKFSIISIIIHVYVALYP